MTLTSIKILYMKLILLISYITLYLLFYETGWITNWIPECPDTPDPPSLSRNQQNRFFFCYKETKS